MSYRQNNQRYAQPSSGVPRDNRRGGHQQGRGRSRPRDFYRLQSYNDKKSKEVWGRMVETEERANQARQHLRTGPPRPQARPAAPARTVQSTVTSAPRFDPMYDGDAAASRPVTVQLGHNIDYSGFAVIIEETYRQCESENPRMSRELPFCVYQHALVEHLNAYLMHQQKFENADPRFQADMDPLEVINAKDFQIPAVVHNYISGVGKALTPTGVSVKVNLPAAGTPRGLVDHLDSGSFGQWVIWTDRLRNAQCVRMLLVTIHVDEID